VCVPFQIGEIFTICLVASLMSASFKQAFINRLYPGKKEGRVSLDTAVNKFAADGGKYLLQKRGKNSSGGKVIVFICDCGEDAGAMRAEKGSARDAAARKKDPDQEEEDALQEVAGLDRLPEQEEEDAFHGTAALDRLLAVMEKVDAPPTVEDMAREFARELERTRGVAVLRGGVWETEFANSSERLSTTLLVYGEWTVERLKELLRLNDQPVFNSNKPLCLERAAMITISGWAAGRCDKCGGFLHWDKVQMMWVCSGNYETTSAKALACDFTTSTPPVVQTKLLKSTELDPSQLCGFRAIARYSQAEESEGWSFRFDEDGTVLTHNNCMGSKRMKGTEVRARLETVITKDGCISESSLKGQASHAKVSGVPASTLRHHLSLINHEAVTVPRRDGYSQIMGFVQAFVQENPGSVGILVLKDNNTLAVRKQVSFLYKLSIYPYWFSAFRCMKRLSF
jgi:hypothetical protein